jgi:hypothetical protein
MAHLLFDRVKETTTTTGTGDITLAGAVSGFRAFSSVLAAGDTTLYCIELNAEWEVGVGTYNTTLARTTVLASSNAGALVSFSAGTKNVFITFTTAGPVGSMSAGVTPSVISVGAEFTGTGVPTATLPGTHALNDILVLALQSSNEDLATPTGYTRLSPENGIGASVTAGSTRLGIFWKRDGGSESAPTLADSGDHTYGFMFAVRGCPTSGDPFHFIANNWKFTASTTGTAKGGETYVDNCLIANIFATAIDNAGAQASSPTNSDLTSITENFDDGTTDGTGGGLALISGVRAAAGTFGDTTVTWGTSTVDLSTTIAFLPATTIERAFRGPCSQTFIGSLPNLTDVYVKPTGVRKIFVQLCDGGGSGSGGNTTTTAAGGGGGGGGGYDEAWFDARDVASPATLRAGAGGAAGTALNQAGNAGTISTFDSGTRSPFTVRVTGTAATAAASADGGNGGCGSGNTLVSPAVATTRLSPEVTTDGVAYGGVGGRGGSGSTGPTGGGVGEWGGGGGESGADTDAATTSDNNGWSRRGGGGGAGGRTNTNISGSGHGGGAAGVNSAQGAAGTDSTRLPYGGSGGCGGGSSVVLGGLGGFPGGGGGGGAGVAGGFGGAGGHGCIVVTSWFT